MNSDGGLQVCRPLVNPIYDHTFLMLSVPPTSVSRALAVSHGPSCDTSYFHGLLLFNIVEFIIFPSWSVSTFRIAAVAYKFFLYHQLHKHSALQEENSQSVFIK